jgi:hypothetical protein
MFSRNELETLAQSFALLGKACKKIHKVLQDKLELKPCDKCKEIETIETEDFYQKAIDFVSHHNMVWSSDSARIFFKHMVNQRLRYNGQNSCWVHTGDGSNSALRDRKSWKTISNTKVEIIFANIKMGWERVHDFLENEPRPENIIEKRWSRRFEVLKSHFPDRLFTKGGFKDVLLSNHKDLPKLK